NLGGSARAKGFMPGTPGEGGAFAAALNRTENGLVRDRYLEVTDQARRVPVAIALIVDQAHVSRVQTAFADSALRFLTHQALLHRYPGSVRPLETLQLAGDGPEGAPGSDTAGPGGLGAYPGRPSGFPGRMYGGGVFGPAAPFIRPGAAAPGAPGPGSDVGAPVG